MKKHLSMLLALTLLTGLTGCAKQPDAPDHNTPVMEFQAQTWKLAAGSSESPEGQAAALFADSVTNATNGAVRVEVVSADAEDADLCFLSGEAARALDERMSVVSLPFLFSSAEQAEACLDGTGGEALTAVLSEHQLRCLGIGSEGFRCPTNNQRPIHSPEDLQGLKLRVADIPVVQEAYRLWGADCVTAAWPIVFTALRTGTYDGQEEPLPIADSAAVQSVQAYATQWTGIYSCQYFCMEQSLYDALSPALQEIVDRYGQEAMAQQRLLRRQQEQEILSGWLRARVAVTVLTEEDAALFRTAAQPCYDRFEKRFSTEFLSAFTQN